MPTKTKARFESPKDLILFGVMTYVAGFIFAALDKASSELIRGDAFFFGSIALLTGVTIWICQRFSQDRLAVLLPRLYFALGVFGWIFISHQLVFSNIGVFSSIFLSFACLVLLWGVWLLTWYPSITINAEQSSASNSPPLPEADVPESKFE